MEIEVKTIYKTDYSFAISQSRKVMFFQGRVTDEAGIIKLITAHGYLGGKEKLSEKVVKTGKNIGKSNETSAVTQAIAECNSKFLEKLKEGYKTKSYFTHKLTNSNIKDLSVIHLESLADHEIANLYYTLLDVKFNTDNNDLFKPMLAEIYKADKSKIKKYVHIQNKYNGVRCLAENFENTILTRSREGTRYIVNHLNFQEIYRQFNALYPNLGSIILDGELYSHGIKLEEIVSLVKTPSMLSNQIDYIVYDCIIPNYLNMAFVDRYQILKTIITNNPSIKLAPTSRYEVNNTLNVNIQAEFKTAVELNYEGVMIRVDENYYEPGFRSSTLLKVKGTESKDFTIVGKTEDISKIQDFCFICTTEKGVKFEVKAHGTVEERKEIYNNFENYIGKKLQLEFHEYTKAGIPFHIKSVIVRNYE